MHRGQSALPTDLSAVRRAGRGASGRGAARGGVCSRDEASVQLCHCTAALTGVDTFAPLVALLQTEHHRRSQPNTHIEMQQLDGSAGSGSGGQSGAPFGEQLDYWISQSSRLSDSLIESQLRASSAEAEVARLAPLEAQWGMLSAEARTLSEARANALVENARLADWNAQLRTLTANQEKELQQLRRVLAEKDAQSVQLQSQLSASNSAHTAAASSLQLQAAYQAKLAEVEAALAQSQRQCSEHSSLQFNYKVLHAKYEHLKAGRAKFEEALLGSQMDARKTQEQNELYRSQMEVVCVEMESIRGDMLRREEERATLLDQVATLSEQNALYRAHVTRATAKISQMEHGVLVARTKLYQSLQAVRQEHSRVRQECAFMLQEEQERCAKVLQQVVAQVSAQARASAEDILRGKRQQAQLQAHLHEDHLMHNLQMEKQEQKLRQLLEFSTGAAATGAQLQRKQQQQQQSQLTQQQPSSSSQPPSTSTEPLPAPMTAAPPAAASFVASSSNGSSGFDVRDWLAMQTAPSAARSFGASTTSGAGVDAPAAPAALKRSYVPSALAGGNPAAPAASDASASSSFAHSHSHSHSHSHTQAAASFPYRAPAMATGQSPHASTAAAAPHLLQQQPYAAPPPPPPTFSSLPSSLASSIQPHRSQPPPQPQPPMMHQQQQQPLYSNWPQQQPAGPMQAQAFNHGSYAPPLPPSHPHAHATHPQHQLLAPDFAASLPPHRTAESSPPPLSRSIHVQRLVEVEAALNAMAEMEQR